MLCDENLSFDEPIYVDIKFKCRKVRGYFYNTSVLGYKTVELLALFAFWSAKLEGPTCIAY